MTCRNGSDHGLMLSAPGSGAVGTTGGAAGPALVAGGRTWSWPDLAAAARAEREALSAAGVDRSAAVVFDAHPAARTVIRLLALIDGGRCAVPLHPRLSRAERVERAGRAATLRPAYDLDAGAWIRADSASGAAAAGSVDPAPRGPGAAAEPTTDDAPLAILFTSGSAGTCRAVELSRRAFRASAEASARHLGWRDDDRWLCCLPLAHVGGLSIVTRCLLARRTVVLVEGGFDPGAVLRSIGENRVTLASFVPTMLHRLFEADAGWRPSPRLRAALLGGAPATPALWREIEHRDVPALATYGMTETCSQVATGRPDAPRDLVPLPGVRVRVVDGRIEVGGPTLCTRVEPPVAESRTADGFFRTGDLGRLAGGVLEVLGRADETIITGGENVAPLEVELALAEHPAVRRAVVFGLPDDTWGELVVAVLEGDPSAPRPSDEAFRAWLDERLAQFRRPRRVVWLSHLPETDTGKPDRRAAADLGRARARPV